jgi:hypothetical protein
MTTLVMNKLHLYKKLAEFFLTSPNLFSFQFFSVAQETILKQRTLGERLAAVQECSDYLNSFTFDEKLKSEEEKGEYIVFRPNGVLLCYSKRMANVPIFLHLSISTIFNAKSAINSSN